MTTACRGMFAALVVAGALAASVATAEPAAAETPVLRAPVDAPVTDPFRAPATPYGPGHRGIEYGTEPGAAVWAPAAGTVGFAGLVAGRRYVAVDHGGGLRSTVGPLERIDVAVAQRVEPGTPLGRAAGRVLLTVRRNGAYVDPGPLLVAGPPEVRLVADDDGPLDRLRRSRLRRSHPQWPWLRPGPGR